MLNEGKNFQKTIKKNQKHSYRSSTWLCQFLYISTFQKSKSHKYQCINRHSTHTKFLLQNIQLVLELSSDEKNYCFTTSRRCLDLLLVCWKKNTADRPWQALSLLKVVRDRPGIRKKIEHFTKGVCFFHWCSAIRTLFQGHISSIRSGVEVCLNK